MGSLSDSGNSWPKTYQLEGFTYDRLESDRPSSTYIQWLNGDPSSSPQPYEHLANIFRESGQPVKANDILYAAKERQRRKAWASKDNHGQPKRREWLRALGLYTMRETIGYGLGNRYFRVLEWVVFSTLVGTNVLIYLGSHSLEQPITFASLHQLLPIIFASLDQLLPIITLDEAHDVLIFGDRAATPKVGPQPYCVLVYFYLHMMFGWILGSFLVAGLSGLTQRN